jgi:ATP-binding cassette, subfamily B, bacterial
MMILDSRRTPDARWPALAGVRAAPTRTSSSPRSRTRTNPCLAASSRGATTWSIGQRQRVALARAFFRDAPFVILDEPTAALDARAESHLFDRMRELLAGRSVLLISHRFSSVRAADRIYVLDHGKVIEHGSHEDLMDVEGRYAELFRLQAAAYLRS